MKTRALCFVRVCVILALLLILALSGRPPATALARTDAAAPAASDPSALIFVENVGQFVDGARFQVRGAQRGAVWLSEDAIWLTILEPAEPNGALSPFDPEWADQQLVDRPREGANIRLSFAGANPHPTLEPFNHLETHVSFFTGSDPAKWRADVPAWGGVRYVDLYPGIDLELTSEQGRVVPRLVARPGADLSAVRLRVEGAEAIAVEGDALRLVTAASGAAYWWPLLRAGGSIAEASVQSLGALTFDVTSPFTSHAPGSPIANPKSEPPESSSDLLYGTFLGGIQGDFGEGIAVDGIGAAYITGITGSSDFPTTPGAFDTAFDGGDAFVAKLNADGSALDYATFLGGSSYDQGHGIAVDGSGMAYIIGWTQSPDFPVTPGAFDTSLGIADIFVAKLNADGSALGYATFLGGSSGEGGRGIAVDGSGAAYVAGSTESSDFPTTPGAFDTTYNRTGDAFVAKLNEAGSALDYATFLGGGAGDGADGIAVDGSGTAYVVGSTRSSNFPVTPDAFDISCCDTYNDAFVAKLSADGSALGYGTFLGGSYLDYGESIAVDGSGVAYVTGHTYSSDFPTTPGAFDPIGKGDWDAFVVELNTTGSALAYATLLGGSSTDYAYSIAVDASGAAYVAGYTFSRDFPTTCGAFDRTYDEGDAFVARLNADGSGLDYATFLGGSNSDDGYGVAVDGSGAAYVAGHTLSSDFPTTPGAFDTTHNGSNEAFAAKLVMEPSICFYSYLPVVLQNY